MSRRLLIAGNWKMHLTVSQARELASQVAAGLKRSDLDVLLAPHYLALATVVEATKGTPILTAAQNLYWEDEGAFTGCVSGPMIKDLGANYVIIGHSERRQFFNESEKTVSLRVAAALRAKLGPILCVGETLAERDKGQTPGVLESQLAGALAGLGEAQMSGIIIAYEPVWAIGTGLNATVEQAAEAHGQIRAWLEGRFGPQVASSCRILYGGSVKPANAAGLLSQADVDGALVGGASLTAESFLGIVAAA